MDVDVFIAGAGPAGCATGISLAQFAPELRVAIADGPARQTLRIGEVVPPPIRHVLEHLGLFHKFEDDAHCASYRTLSAWGSSKLGSNEFLLQPQQVGWRLDRTKFDAMMVRAATSSATLCIPARVTGLSRLAESWRVDCSDGSRHAAVAVVDATGRAAGLARLLGLHPAMHDRLVGCFMHFESDADGHQELMLESFSDGWWYTSAIPDGRRVVACMTDSDQVQHLGLARLDRWMRCLTETDHVGPCAAGLRPLGLPRLRPAGSQILKDAAPNSFISVGDAASCFDPISGQGIFKALRSGIFASYAIADLLRRDANKGVKRHRAIVRGEFASYRKTLHDYYALEQRWLDRPFWQRRRDEKDAAIRYPFPGACSETAHAEG